MSQQKLSSSTAVIEWHYKADTLDSQKIINIYSTIFVSSSTQWDRKILSFNLASSVLGAISLRMNSVVF